MMMRLWAMKPDSWLTLPLTLFALSISIIYSWGPHKLRHPISIKLFATALSPNFGHTLQSLEGYDDSLKSLVFDVIAKNSRKMSDRQMSISSMCDCIEIWQSALVRGHLPENCDWPQEPLGSHVFQCFQALNIPRLCSVHPEIVGAVMKGLLESHLDFHDRLDRGEQLRELEAKESSHSCEDDYLISDDEHIDTSPRNQMSADDVDDVAKSVMREFTSAWGPPMGALTTLDQVYGPNHGLLSLSGQDGVSGGGGAGQGGFGLFDGIWHHTGWKQMKEVQTQLRSMKELRNLLRSVGRRPSADGDHMRLTPPQREGGAHSPMGVAFSQHCPTQVTGLRRSDSLEGLLPAEAILLVSRNHHLQQSPKEQTHDNFPSHLQLHHHHNEQHQHQHQQPGWDGPLGGNGEMLHAMETREEVAPSLASSGRLKLLFRARQAEKQLRSYELAGWLDQPSLPKRKPWRHFSRLPTAEGGPIIVCLDTSWSMAGPREGLAKAVVLESSIMAAKEGRDCFVLAFSGGGNLAECELKLGATKAGIAKLLQFLSNSFRGGTDVTSPLVRAIDLIENTMEWSGADVVLVTDGELQMPPVATPVMEKLRRLESQRGLEVHGLLVGRNFSAPLEELCTRWDGQHRVHDFLCKFDPLTVLKLAQQKQQQQQQQQHEQQGSGTALSQSLRTSYTNDEDEDEDEDGKSVGAYHRPKANAKAKARRNSRSESKLYASSPDASLLSMEAWPSRLFDDLLGDNPPARLTEHALSVARAQVDRALANLVEEQQSGDVVGRQRIIGAALARLGEGLVERDVEIQLLLLAALSGEHILLLGPPGTGKSDLGRRLAQITGGLFFERLLTKYTNPEELFGPLSLSALERDEYVRKVDGYLPTASVAFLDEIFKANSAILNSLLTILNERLFDNGVERRRVPLAAVVGASNELPDSDELEALYDRFLVRRRVSAVSDGAIGELIEASQAAARKAASAGVRGATNLEAVDEMHKHQLSQEGPLLTEVFVDDVKRRAAEVVVPPDVVAILRDTRAFLRDDAEQPVVVSDRRLVKAVGMLRVSAVCNGRTKVSPLDCLLLQHMLWYEPEDQAGLSEWLWQRVMPDSGLKGLQFLVSAAQQRLVKEIEQGVEDGGSLDELKMMQRVLIEKAVSLKYMARECRGSPSPSKGDFSSSQTNAETDSKMSENHLWLSPSEVITARQQLAPAADAGACSLEQLLAYVNCIIQVTESNVQYSHLFDDISKAFAPKQDEFAMDEAGGSSLSQSSAVLSALELSLSKKEAQRALSPEKFKVWKKEKAKRKSKNYAGDDEFVGSSVWPATPGESFVPHTQAADS